MRKVKLLPTRNCEAGYGPGGESTKPSEAKFASKQKTKQKQKQKDI